MEKWLQQNQTYKKIRKQINISAKYQHVFISAVALIPMLVLHIDQSKSFLPTTTEKLLTRRRQNNQH